MKITALIIAIILLSGCAGKRLYFGYPPIERTDTLTVIDTIEIDVPVFFPMPLDTVRLFDTIYVKDAPHTLIDTLRTEFAESLCGWRDGIMLHELYHRDAIIRDTVRVPIFNETITIRKDTVHQVPVTPWWHKWVLFVLIAVIGLLVLKR